MYAGFHNIWITETKNTFLAYKAINIRFDIQKADYLIFIHILLKNLYQILTTKEVYLKSTFYPLSNKNLYFQFGEKLFIVNYSKLIKFIMTIIILPSSFIFVFSIILTCHSKI